MSSDVATSAATAETASHLGSEPPALRVVGLGKQYQIGVTAGVRRYGSLREDAAASLKRLGRRRSRRAVASSDEDGGRTFWALRDVTFDVAAGERVGIIGRNGAGKSTLFKVLSEITAPTEGRVEVRGRLGALLEVGTGFHPELTGRDNVFLAGAILGMRREQIRARIDEIIEFAGIGPFVDTPVKRYSSGMYLRLAFAVAAHLEPDILLVDEVLAVGDADFQKKCLGRMAEIGSEGRTVVFVSHSMPSILRLCNRVILLDRGRVVADGDPQEVVRVYLDAGYGSTAERHWDTDSAPGDAVARLRSVRVLVDGRVEEQVEIRQPVDIEVTYEQLTDDPDLRPMVELGFFDEDDVNLFVSVDAVNRAWRATARRAGVVTATCRVPGNLLAEGRMRVLAALRTHNPDGVHAVERDAVSFQVVDRTAGDGARAEYVGPWAGVVRPLLDWSVEPR